MEVKNGIIIDGVLHEMVELIDARCLDFDCSKCSLNKECNECKMEHESYLCNVMGCFFFVSRGKVTDIKTKEEKKSSLFACPTPGVLKGLRTCYPPILPLFT